MPEILMFVFSFALGFIGGSLIPFILLRKRCQPPKSYNLTDVSTDCLKTDPPPAPFSGSSVDSDSAGKHFNVQK